MSALLVYAGAWPHIASCSSGWVSSNLYLGGLSELGWGRRNRELLIVVGQVTSAVSKL